MHATYRLPISELQIFKRYKKTEFVTFLYLRRFFWRESNGNEMKMAEKFCWAVRSSAML
jgi:hypothetical protein